MYAVTVDVRYQSNERNGNTRCPAGRPTLCVASASRSGLLALLMILPIVRAFLGNLSVPSLPDVTISFAHICEQENTRENNNSHRLQFPFVPSSRLCNPVIPPQTLRIRVSTTLSVINTQLIGYIFRTDLLTS